MSDQSTPAQSLAKLSDYVTGLAAAQQQRLDHMQDLATSVSSAQSYLSELEAEVARLRADLASAHEREERLKVVLVGEQATREALVISHADEIAQMQSTHQRALEQAGQNAIESIQDLKRLTDGAIATIKEDANAAILAAQDETQSIRADHALLVAENDRLNEGMNLLINLVEGTANDAYKESRTIAEMISAIDSRLPSGPAGNTTLIDHGNLLHQDRAA